MMIRMASSFCKQNILKLRILICAVLIGSVLCLGLGWEAEVAAQMRESEPNDTMDTARPISLNQTYIGNLQGSSDVDYYSFEITEQGISQLSFSHANVSAGVWNVEIRDDKNKQISGFCSEADDASKKSFRLRLPWGKYYIRISSGIFNKADYRLSLDFVEENGAYEQEPNDSMRDAYELGVNQRWTGNLQGYGDKDWYKFEIPSSGNLQIEFSHAAAAKTGNWRVQLWDENHILTSLLVKEEDTQKKSDTLNLAAGQYYLKVFHPYPEEIPIDPATTPSSQTISYTFSDIDYQFIIGFVPLWETDPANAAQGVAVGKNITINFSSRKKILDSSKMISLIRDDGVNIPINTFLSDASAIIIPYTTLDYYTTYTVKVPAGLVKDNYGNVLGEYQFSFTTEIAPVQVISGTEIFPGIPKNATFNTGEEIQRYYFTSKTAATYIIETLGNVDTIGTLYSNVLRINDDDSGSWRNFRIIRYLPANTTYGLNISSWGKSTGSYTINIMEVRSFTGNDWPQKINVPITKDYNIAFNSAIDPASLKGNVYVKNTRGQDQNVSVSIKPGSGNKEIIVTHPGSGYQPGEIYWLYITAKLKDAGGSFIRQALRMQFTIENRDF